mgnify:CR=1 FL=1
MLTDFHITIIGGDARQIEIIRKLTEMDATVSMVGFDQLDQGFINASKKQLDEIDFNHVDAIVLPVSGTSQNGEVEAVFSGDTIVLSENIFKETPGHCVIYSGISNDYLDACTKNANRTLVKLFERDDIAIYNSIPTVEGTIMMVIQNTDITIHGSKTVVLGFGRTGMSVARAFSALGANVRVGARDLADLARITEMGVRPFHIDDIHREVAQCDVVINTIPAPILKADVIAKMPTHALIVDLASKPGGTDFRYAEKRGVKALLAPGLPGIVAPKTAGKIIASVLVQLLAEDYKRRKGNGG